MAEEDKKKILEQKLKKALEERKKLAGSRWIPKNEGEILMGRVLKRDIAKVYKHEIPVWVIETFNGERRQTPPHMVLVRQLEELGVSPGDYVIIQYEGRREGSTGKPVWIYSAECISAEEARQILGIGEPTTSESYTESTFDRETDTETTTATEDKVESGEDTEIDPDKLISLKRKTAQLIETLGKVSITYYDDYINKTWKYDIPVDLAIKLLDLKVENGYIVGFRE